MERGRVTVSLGSLATMQPACFSEATKAAEKMEIVLPLKEIVEQFGEFPIAAEPVIEGENLLVERKTPTPRETANARNSGIRMTLDFRAIAANLPGLETLADGSQNLSISIQLSQVEEQLGKGAVSIPLQELLTQLPPKFRTPIANLGLNEIPLPLGEIFRNLPGGKAPQRSRTAPPKPEEKPGPATPQPKPAAATTVEPPTPQTVETPSPSTPVNAPAKPPEPAPIPQPASQIPPTTKPSAPEALPVTLEIVPSSTTPSPDSKALQPAPAKSFGPPRAKVPPPPLLGRNTAVTPDVLAQKKLDTSAPSVPTPANSATSPAQTPAATTAAGLAASEIKTLTGVLGCVVLIADDMASVGTLPFGFNLRAFRVEAWSVCDSLHATLERLRVGKINAWTVSAEHGRFTWILNAKGVACIALESAELTPETLEKAKSILARFAP